MTWCDRIKHDVPAWKPGQIHVPLLRLCLILGGDALWTWQFLSILSSSWKAHERWDFMDGSTSCTGTHSPPFPSTDVSAWQPKHWVALSFTPARSTLPAGSRRYLQLKGFATFQVRLLNVRVYPATLGTLVKPCPYLEFTPSMNLHQYCKSPATVLKDMLSTPNFPVWKAMPCRVDQSGKQHLPKRKNTCARFGKRQPYFWCKTKFKAG